MKKQSSFNTRDLKNSTPRARHNLSYRNAMSAPFGALVPFLCQEVVAGSSCKIGLEHQTRARSMPKPSFSRIREHYDYFFVPFAQLYHNYDNFRTMQNNQRSMLFKNAYPQVSRFLPHFLISNLLVEKSNRVNEKDINDYPAVFGTCRLLDLLGYGVSNSLVEQSGDYPSQDDTVWYNPFRLLAYQKIYFDYFRNDKYEDNDTECYNIDDIANTGSAQDISDIRMKKITMLRYRWRKKDYFTQVTPDIMVSPNQFARTGFNLQHLTMAGNSAFANTYLQQYSAGVPLTNNGPFIAGEGYVNNPDSQSSPITPVAGANVQFAVQAQGPQGQVVQNHRWATALDKLLRRMYAAKSDFSSQMLAIFGITPPEGRNGNVSHIGGYSQILGISDVNNQSDTNAVSPLFGKINQYGNTKSFTYKAYEDGIIMGIYSTSMENDYSSLRVSRHNLKLSPFDYFMPQFAGLGKQSLFSIEYQKYYLTDEGDNEHMPLGVIGFVPRYDEYRSHVDEIHGAFDAGTESAFAAPVNVDMTVGKLYLNMRNLIYSPKMLNRIFAVHYNGEESTDHFLLNLYNKLKVISPIPLRVEV